MKPSTLEQLHAENQHLREAILSLSARLLRNSALKRAKNGQGVGGAVAERLLREAEDCFHCARLPGLKKEIAAGLEAAGNEFLAMAVRADVERQRDRRKK